MRNTKRTIAKMELGKFSLGLVLFGRALGGIFFKKSQVDKGFFPSKRIASILLVTGGGGLGYFFQEENTPNQCE